MHDVTISPYLFFHPVQSVYLQVHSYRKIITVCKSKLLHTVIIPAWERKKREKEETEGEIAEKTREEWKNHAFNPQLLINLTESLSA